MTQTSCNATLYGRKGSGCMQASALKISVTSRNVLKIEANETHDRTYAQRSEMLAV